jgi:hypothetical protein
MTTDRSGGARTSAWRRWRPVAATVVSHVTAVAWVGVLSGVVMGALGRLLMRLSFLLRRDTAGQLTEAGERIGVFTLEGTVAFVIFAGVVNGLLAAAIYLVLEPWLRTLGEVERWRWHGAGILGAALALLGPLAYTDELDFVILRPPLVHVVLFGLLPVVGAVVFWLLLRRQTRRGPRATPLPRWRWALRLLGAALFAPVLLAGQVPALFDTTFSRPAVAALPAYLLAGVATLAWWQRRAVGAAPPAWLVRVGVGCTAAVIVLGVGQFLRVAVDQL